jgi:hypothetical protein
MLEDLQPKPNKSCKVRNMADELEEKDRAIFIAAINDTENWLSKTLARELTVRGLKIVGETITKHRRGECSC